MPEIDVVMLAEQAGFGDIRRTYTSEGHAKFARLVELVRAQSDKAHVEPAAWFPPLR